MRSAQVYAGAHMNASKPVRLACPHCQAAVRRTPRSLADRWLSLVMPVVRCRCTSLPCGWEGLIYRGAPVTGSGHGGHYLPSQILEPSRGNKGWHGRAAK